MLRCFAFAVGNLLLAALAIAGPATWRVDPDKSSLTFLAVVNGQTVTGAFPSFSAVIAFDPADLAHSSATIVIDIGKVKSGDATRDAMLLKPDWFNVRDFPHAVFRTTSFSPKGGDRYEARGTLTIKGVSKEIVIPLAIAIAGDAARATGEVTLLRTAFNVGRGQEFANDRPVGRAVKVVVDLLARRAK